MTTDGGRIAWFHCFAGIAGDMALGSLIDAGADLEGIRSGLERLPIRGWSLECEPVVRGGLSATRAVVGVDDDGTSRTLPDLLAIIDQAGLPERVVTRSSATFRSLAEIEGGIHRRPPNEVHFHELGGHDTVIDVVGTAIALELLGVDVVRSSPVATGVGMVRSQHGPIPNPAPAVVALLRGAPVYGRDVNVELTTPTGAAILATMGSGYGPIPPMTIEATGYGAGGRDLDGFPNCTQVILGRPSSPAPGAPVGQPQQLIEANLDDATGEQIADTIAALFEAGAADAWVTPVLMKKGRPGQVLSVLCDLALAAQLRQVILDEGGSLGARSVVVDRFASVRHESLVEVEGRPIRVKVSPGRAKIEHDDARRVAGELGLPVREVTARAEAAWRSRPLESEG